MPDEDDLIVRIKSVYSDVPSDMKGEVSRLFDEVILKVRSSVAYKTVRPLIIGVPKFAERSDKQVTAIEFFRANYGALLATGCFFANDLRRHDQRLYDTLSVYQASRGQRMCDLMPTRGRSVGEAKSEIRRVASA